jgi:hypothetical protein
VKPEPWRNSSWCFVCQHGARFTGSQRAAAWQLRGHARAQHNPALRERARFEACEVLRVAWCGLTGRESCARIRRAHATRGCAALELKHPAVPLPPSVAAGNARDPQRYKIHILWQVHSRRPQGASTREIECGTAATAAPQATAATTWHYDTPHAAQQRNAGHERHTTPRAHTLLTVVRKNRTHSGAAKRVSGEARSLEALPAAGAGVLCAGGAGVAAPAGLATTSLGDTCAGPAESTAGTRTTRSAMVASGRQCGGEVRPVLRCAGSAARGLCPGVRSTA